MQLAKDRILRFSLPQQQRGILHQVLRDFLAMLDRLHLIIKYKMLLIIKYKMLMHGWVLVHCFVVLWQRWPVLKCSVIDRLFDRGYLSFVGSGPLIFSPLLPSDVIDAWALSIPALEKPLSHKQSAYMGFHRSEIDCNSE